MRHPDSTVATSRGESSTFTLDWNAMTWTNPTELEEAAFPFVAQIDGKRYELYSDGRFDEEELGEGEHEPDDG
jgi:hypothetical protein